MQMSWVNMQINYLTNEEQKKKKHTGARAEIWRDDDDAYLKDVLNPPKKTRL